MKKILFVCTGNICRSPTAEGVFRHYLAKDRLAEKIATDSAGTHGYHVGEAPDMRAINTAKKRGFEIDGLRARRLAPKDFHEFDLILGLDYEHVSFMRRMAPKDAPARVELFLEYAGGTRETEVPDPYYGASHDFEYALDLIDAGSRALIARLKTELEVN